VAVAGCRRVRRLAARRCRCPPRRWHTCRSRCWYWPWAAQQTATRGRNVQLGR